MNSQNNLDQLALDLLPTISDLIKKAPKFEANQMRCFTLREINNSIIPLNDMGSLVDAFEGFLILSFEHKGWI